MDRARGLQMKIGIIIHNGSIQFAYMKRTHNRLKILLVLICLNAETMLSYRCVIVSHSKVRIPRSRSSWMAAAAAVAEADALWGEGAIMARQRQQLRMRRRAKSVL